MTTSLSRCWLLAALFFLAVVPVAAFAQTADLAIIVQENGPDPAVAGQDSLDSTVEVQNLGPDDATNVAIDLSAVVTGGSISSPLCVYTPSSGTFSWPTWTLPTLSNGALAILTEVCPLSANSSDGANRELTAAVASLDQTDDNAANDSASIDTTVVRVTNFTMSVTCTPDTVLAGSGAGNLSCTVDVGQSGPSDASNVAVAMTLPAGVTIDSGTPSVGSWLDPTWTIGDAAVGFSGSLGLVLTVDSTASGDLTIEANLTANETNNGASTASDVAAAESAGDAPTTFDTSIVFTNGNPGSATVTRTCNAGVPLNQVYQVSTTEPVQFTSELLDFLAPGVDCTITLSGLEDGYVGSFLANGVDTGDACVFSSEPEAGEAPFDISLERMNTCEITAEPVVSEYAVEKVWEFDSNGIIDVSANIHIWCSPAATDTGPSFGTVQTWVTAYDDATFTLRFYPTWDGGATCYAQESNLDSAVESDNGCAEGTDFEVGDLEGGCTITNTVFFEGIPTLNQWGLALMALLMLGVGFVGMRRFA